MEQKAGINLSQKPRRAIVTGATGFIGTALCRELLEHGYEVTAVIRSGSAKREKLENLKQSLPEAAERLHIRELSLENLSDLAKEQMQADLFFHLAWNGSSGQERDSLEIQLTNLSYMAEAIRTARKCGCRKFLGAGSQAEYGIVHGKAKEEETVPKPFFMYGAAKLAAYHMGRLTAEQEGIAFVWPRIYSIYGPGENPGTLVSYLVDSLQRGEVPQVTECENLWDFTYIGDCVRMLRMLGEHPDTEGVYNLSAGEPRKLREFAAELRDIVHPGMEIDFGARQADPQRTFWLEPDVSRIREVCGACSVSFAEGIRRKAETSDAVKRGYQNEPR